MVVLKIVSVVHGVVPSDRVHHSLVHLGAVLGSDLKRKVAFPVTAVLREVVVSTVAVTLDLVVELDLQVVN